MKVEQTTLPDVILLTPRRITDERGYFMEVFRLDKLQRLTNSDIQFAQENQSHSTKRNTIRGLHYQAPPRAQGKLVRCSQGRIMDVAVDVRLGSPSYGESVTVELSALNNHQLWIPAGFLHGFRTLEDDTVVNYHCTDVYSHDDEGSVLWDDSDLGIDWGVEAASSISDRDLAAERFANWTSPFRFRSGR